MGSRRGSKLKNCKTTDCHITLQANIYWYVSMYIFEFTLFLMCFSEGNFIVPAHIQCCTLVLHVPISSYCERSKEKCLLQFFFESFYTYYVQKSLSQAMDTSQVSLYETRDPHTLMVTWVPLPSQSPMLNFILLYKPNSLTVIPLLLISDI